MSVTPRHRILVEALSNKRAMHEVPSRDSTSFLEKITEVRPFMCSFRVLSATAP
jgi:hypothetical protein